MKPEEIARYIDTDPDLLRGRIAMREMMASTFPPGSRDRDRQHEAANELRDMLARAEAARRVC